MAVTSSFSPSVMGGGGGGRAAIIEGEGSLTSKEKEKKYYV